jgi:5-methyltetrahydropteroyltriglutamate--homocysteine methyltransferase
MKYSTERILTTHAGALPQPADLKAMHTARAAGRSIEPQAFAKRIREAVAEVVRKQIACGLDIINDGEVGKSNFSRYARERLSGFVEREVKPDERASTIYARDMVEFGDYFNNRASHRGDNLKRVFCNAPLKYVGRESLCAEIEDFKAALQGQKYQEAFLPAIAPGTIEHWMKNDYYPNDEAYLLAIADAMHEEYKAIVDAGFLLQIDDPDLPD